MALPHLRLNRAQDMADFLYLMLGLGGFLALALYVRFCNRL